MAKPTKSQLEAMRKLGMTEEEIADVVKSDEAIDKGEKLFELTAEQEKASKQARNSGTRKTPTVYKLDNADGKRSRKENPTKEGIIQLLATFLQENGNFSAVNITNASRMIAFSCENDDFELTLVQKRKKK